MTEKEHPYRATPPVVALRPRYATLVGQGSALNGGESVDRVVEALAVGDGHLVTVTELRMIRVGDPQGPGLGRLHLEALACAPVFQRERTTFYTTATLDQIRSGFFENADVVPSRRATMPALPVDDTGAAEERQRTDEAIRLLLDLRQLTADVWDGGLEDDTGAWPSLRERIDAWLRSESERRQSPVETISVHPTVEKA